MDLGNRISGIKRPNVVSEIADYTDSRTCSSEDRGGPPGAAMQVEAPNHHKLLLPKATVVSVDGKGHAGHGQVSAMEANKGEPLITCRKRRNAIKTGRESLARDEPGGAQTDLMKRPNVGSPFSYLLTVQAVTGMEAARTLHRLRLRTWEAAPGYEGRNPSSGSARIRVPMPGAESEQPIVVMNARNWAGAKGLCCAAQLSGQPKGRSL